MIHKRSVLIQNCIALIALFIIVVGLPIVTSAQPTAPTVLAELFRNINCNNCQIPDNNYGNYMSTHPGVVLINYHNSTGDPQDPFFTASLPASNDRDQFYGGLSDPSAYIDGVFAGTGSTTEATWELYSTSAMGHASIITPTVAHGPGGIDTITFPVTGSSGVQVVAYVAIKESQIYYVNAEKYGTPPGNLWNDVFRTMLPSPKGSAAFPFSGTRNDTVIYDPSNYTFTGNEQNMTAVIFVQDANATGSNNSHQVEAVGEVSLAPPSAVTETTAPSNRLIISENPITQHGHIGIELQSPSEVQLTLSDLLGREVRSLVDGRMPAGQTSVELEGSGLTAGCYVAHLSIDGRDAGHAMLVIVQ